MSQKSTFQISCPFCRHEQTVELWDALNVQEDPGLREELLASRINLVTCGACEKHFRVDKSLVYIDVDQEIMVHLEPLTKGRTLEQVSADFVEAERLLQKKFPPDVPAPSIHLVVDWAELIERIFVLEEGLDSRVIEYVKYGMHRMNPKKLPADKKRLLFDVADSSDEQLTFVVQDLESRRLEATLNFSRTDYEGLLNLFDGDEQTALLLEQFPGPYFNGRMRYLQDQLDGRIAQT